MGLTKIPLTRGSNRTVVIFSVSALRLTKSPRLTESHAMVMLVPLKLRVHYFCIFFSYTQIADSPRRHFSYSSLSPTSEQFMVNAPLNDIIVCDVLQLIHDYLLQIVTKTRQVYLEPAACFFYFSSSKHSWNDSDYIPHITKHLMV